MIYYSALATISNIYVETFKGKVNHLNEIESDIAKQALKKGDVFTVTIQEMITANSPEALEDKEYNF